MMPTIKTNVNWANVKFWSLVLSIGIFTWWSINNNIKSTREYRSVACPSLFSIARSSRDTLIVMKNVDVCVDYIIDNLQ